MDEDLAGAIRARMQALRGLGYRVKFVVEDSGETFLLDGTGPSPRLEAADGEADTTLRLSEENLRKLIAGKLNPMLAFSLGRLRVEGSRGVALKLASMLDEG